MEATRRDGGGRLRRAIRRALRVLLVLVVLVLAGAAALYLSTPSVSYLATENPRTTAYIELRRAEAAAERRPFHLDWTWVPLSEIAPVLQHAVVLSEDRRFYRHGGLDGKAIRRVLNRSYEEGRLVAGASTITQQLARNLFLSPERSVLRKLREIVITWRLETALEKERILELYLNVAEWGDDVFGVEAAACAYFDCHASEVTPAQAARLAVALPQPILRSPRIESSSLVYEAAYLLARLCVMGELTVAERDAAFEELGVTDESRPPGPLLAWPTRTVESDEHPSPSR